jgi:hypothetical protein
VGASSALGTIAKVQAGTFVSATGVTSITPTLAAASTSGNLLVAIVTTAANTTVTAPAGWTRATGAFTSTAGATAIWYYANNPGAISSVKFTLSASDSAAAQLSEWSGIETASPLDGTGTATATTSKTTLSVSATAAAANELAITSFAVSGSAGNTFTPATGWTNLMAGHADSRTGDYEIGVGSGSVSEIETASTSGLWAGAIVTFYGSCGGGSLALTSPATATFPGLTLNGTNQSVTTSLAFTPTDSTGSASGWSLAGTSTTFKNAGSKTLPTTATTITAGSVVATSATCRLPTNAIAFPVTLPAAATAPAAVKLFDGGAATGLGASTVTLTFKLSVPPNANNGTFSSTWTFSIASGP